MKKLTVIVSVLFILTGCKNENVNFNLSGQISGLRNDTLYLYPWQGGNNGVDTIIAKDGSFEFGLKVDTVAPLILLADNQSFPVYADKNLKVTVKGDLGAGKTLQIEGGELNDELTNFRNSIASSEPSGKQSAVKAENYIRTHSNSPTSIYILDTYFVQKEQPDYHKITELIKLLSADLQDDGYIKQLSEFSDLQINTEVGKTAPFFSCKDKNGKPITLNDFKDKYVLVTFWASWWKPYSQEQRAMKKLLHNYKKQNLALLGVSLDIDRESWLNAIKKDTLGGVQVTDLKGWENSVVVPYGIEKLPSNILMGPDKKIIARNLNQTDLAGKLEEIFNN